MGLKQNWLDYMLNIFLFSVEEIEGCWNVLKEIVMSSELQLNNFNLGSILSYLCVRWCVY